MSRSKRVAGEVTVVAGTGRHTAVWLVGGWELTLGELVVPRVAVLDKLLSHGHQPLVGGLPAPWALLHVDYRLGLRGPAVLVVVGHDRGGVLRGVALAVGWPQAPHGRCSVAAGVVVGRRRGRAKVGRGQHRLVLPWGVPVAGAVQVLAAVLVDRGRRPVLRGAVEQPAGVQVDRLRRLLEVVVVGGSVRPGVAVGWVRLD